MDKLRCGYEIFLNNEIFGIAHCWQKVGEESGVSVMLDPSQYQTIDIHGLKLTVDHVFLPESEYHRFTCRPRA